MKKNIRKSTYRFLQEEFKFHQSEGIIDKTQVDKMMNFYEESSGLSFIKVLVTIGSILIGLGIISLIASNWDDISKFVKVLIIVAALAVSLFSSFKSKINYPRTSEALLYLSSLIYGAGIFLMEQIFHISGNYTSSFLIWSIGVLVMAMILKNLYLFFFAQFLTIIYINSNFNQFIIIPVVILLALYYYFNKYFKFDKISTLLTVILTLDFILYLLNYYDMIATYIIIIFFIIGQLMFYIKHKLNYDVFRFIGVIVFGISGFILTFEGAWRELNYIRYEGTIAIVFGIIFILLSLNLEYGSIIFFNSSCLFEPVVIILSEIHKNFPKGGPIKFFRIKFISDPIIQDITFFLNINP